MKKILVLWLMLVLIWPLLISQTSNQDLENKLYLGAVDKNVLNTIELLNAFKDGKNKMENDDYNRIQYYDRFLQDVLGECYLIRDNVFSSLNMEPEDREQVVKDIIKSLNPEITYKNSYITNEKDIENRRYLNEISKRLVKLINKTFQEITQEEKKIKEQRAINREYLILHSKHFMYSMLLNYIAPSEHLNKRNRNFLTDITKEIISSMQED